MVQGVLSASDRHPVFFQWHLPMTSQTERKERPGIKCVVCLEINALKHSWTCRRVSLCVHQTREDLVKEQIGRLFSSPQIKQLPHVTAHGIKSNERSKDNEQYSLSLVNGVTDGDDVARTALVQVRRRQCHFARKLDGALVPITLRGVVLLAEQCSGEHQQNSTRRRHEPNQQN